MGDISYFLSKLKKELNVFESLLKTDNGSIYEQFKSVERIEKQLKLIVECREIKNKINKSDD